MTASFEQVAIPIEALDHVEWLALEGLWVSHKSQFDVVATRWRIHPDSIDSESVLGLAVGGNFKRFAFDDAAAREIDQPDDRDRIFSKAALGLAKVAGGFVSVSSHFATPKERWADPTESHVAVHIANARLVNALVPNTKATVYDPDVYYDLFKVLEMRRGLPDLESESWLGQAYQLTILAARLATNTWIEYMDQHVVKLIDPGATPRSAGTNVDKLYAGFMPAKERLMEELHASS